MSKQDNLDSLVEQLHFIMMHVTRNLGIPSAEKAEEVRMKMAVFTYGVATGLVTKTSENAKQLYFQYLHKSGLSEQRAHVMVERTSNLHMKKDFGPPCIQAGKDAVTELDKGDSHYQFDIKGLLF